MFDRFEVTVVVATPLAMATVLAASAASATERGDQLAYEAAMKCYVANGALRGERKDAGDAAGAQAAEVKARQSFDVAVRLGGRLGYANRRINQDFSMAEIQELPKMVKDISYRRAASATCKAMGLG